MRPVNDFTIAPGASVAIAPGHYHIMLMELKSPLAAGGNLALRLVFEQAGAIDLFVPVKADPPAPAMHMH
jgi:copper(I)-binding protein